MDTDQADIGPPASGNQISRASVFGMFLTLWMCFLAQPYGSLLFTKVQSRAGLFIFFFWRLNPLACAAEALVVLYVLLRSWLIRDTPYITSRPSQPWLPKDLQLQAAVLMLLRADKYDRDGVRIEEELAGLDVEADQGRARQFLAEAFSTDVFTSRELFVTASSCVAMLTVIIKLVVSILPWYISVWAWLYVSGWAVVQSVLVLQQSCKIEETEDLSRLIRWFDIIRYYLDYPVLEISWAAITLPFFCYLGHIELFVFPLYPAQEFSPSSSLASVLLQVVKGLFWFFCSLSSMLIASMSMYWVIYGVAAILLETAFRISFLRTEISSTLAFAGWALFQCLLFLSFHDWLIEMGFWISPVCSGVVIWAVLVLTSFEERKTGQFIRGSWPLMNLVGNLVFTTVVFVSVLNNYDPKDSSRPGWTEWLG